MNQERLLNHADAEQMATVIERMADIPRGQNDGDIGELPSHADGMRILNGLNKFDEKLTADLDSKVDKEEGKGLSTNDYTNEEKAKLEGIEAGAEVNVQADWEQSTDSADDFIKNKPSLGTAAAKDYTTTASDGSIDLIESGAVYSGLALKIDATEKGSANGVAELDANGLVPSAQLPSFVDDILEYANTSVFPTTGETGKIYVALDTDRTYRWGGSAYVEVSESLALGETSSTAYAGNKGKANADAISAIKDGSTIDSFADVETALADKVDKVTGKGLSENDFTSTLKTKLDNIESGAQVNTVTGIKGDNESSYRTGNVNITKSNIGLGNVGNFKAVSTVASQALSDAEKTNARANIGLGNVGNFKAVSTISGQGLTDAEKANARANIGAGASGAGVTSIGALTGDLTFAQIMNLSSSGSSTPDDDMYLIASASSGSTTTWYKRKFAKLWDYISGKISSVLGLTSTSYGGNAETATNATHATSATTATSAETATSATSATTASKLGSAVTIDGVDFDGSGAINHYGTCSTTASTSAKTVSCTGFKLVTGARITVRCTTANTTSAPTLNVNSTGATSIYYGGSVTSSSNPFKWAANTIIEFIYSGSYWYVVSCTPELDGGSWYGTCGTSATTASKTSTIDGFRLQIGASVKIRATTAQTYTSGAITLNVNSTGAKTIYVNGSATSSSNTLTWAIGDVLTFVYGGSNWYFAGSTASGGGGGDDFEACTTTFSADGTTITQQYSDRQLVTTFNSNGTITEQLKNAAGTSVTKTKTTTFNSDGSISETVS